MKKLTLLLVVSLVFLLSFNVMAETVTVEYWNLFGGGDAEFMDKIVKEFNATHENIEVDSTRLEWAEYYTKLKTATASGNGPDVAICHVTRLPEMINEGLAVPVDSAAEKVGISWNEFNQNILQGTEKNGKHYAVPLDTHPLVLYYNKDMLSEAGLLDENGKPEIDDYMSFLKTLKEDSSAEYSMTNWTKLTAEGHYRFWWSLYNQLGGKPFLTDGEITLEKDKAIQAINYMKEIYDNDYSPLHSEYMENVNLFRNEKAATLLTGVWITGTLESTEGLNFGVIPMPTMLDERASWADSHTLMLPYTPNQSPEKQKAALTFAKWVTDNGYLWAKAGHIPSKNTIKENEKFQEMPYRMDYVEAADYVVFDKAGSHTWGIRSKMTTALSKVWKDEITPEEAVDMAIENIDRLISR